MWWTLTYHWKNLIEKKIWMETDKEYLLVYKAFLNIQYSKIFEVKNVILVVYTPNRLLFIISFINHLEKITFSTSWLVIKSCNYKNYDYYQQSELFCLDSIFITILVFLMGLNDIY